VQDAVGLQPLPLVTPVPAGHVLVRQDEPAAGLWLVDAGMFSASRVDPDGRELLLDLLGPGDPIGEPNDAASPVTVRAVRPARVRVPTPALVPFLLTQRAYRAQRLACDLAWADVVTRVHGRLQDLADRFGRPMLGGRSVGPITQDQIAAMAGTSRESVSRAIRVLSTRGDVLAVGRRRYVVHERSLTSARS